MVVRHIFVFLCIDKSNGLFLSIFDIGHWYFLVQVYKQNKLFEGKSLINETGCSFTSLMMRRTLIVNLSRQAFNNILTYRSRIKARGFRGGTEYIFQN